MNNLILLILALVLVLIILTSITLYYVVKIKDSSCYKSSFENLDNKYTIDDINKFWTETLKCSKQLSSRDINDALTRGNNWTVAEAEAFLKRRASVYKCNQAPVNIPAGDLLYLQNIWKDSNCPANFPMEFVKQLYDQGSKPPVIIKKFNSYIANVKANINANDFPAQSLEKSFSTCYGNEWKSDKTLSDKYNFVNNLN